MTDYPWEHLQLGCNWRNSIKMIQSLQSAKLTQQKYHCKILEQSKLLTCQISGIWGIWYLCTGAWLNLLRQARRSAIPTGIDTRLENSGITFLRLRRCQYCLECSILECSMRIRQYYNILQYCFWFVPLWLGLSFWGMDVTPTNEVERGFTIGVVVFALVAWHGANSESSACADLFRLQIETLWVSALTLLRWALLMWWAAFLPAWRS